MKKNSKHEIGVLFESKYYNIVRSVVDYYRGNVFDSGIQVCEEDDYTSIWFKVGRGELNWKLCKETFGDMERLGIVKFATIR